MAAFEYLSVLISIILALGMTRVLAGVGEMLQARSHRRIYWVHAMWVINLFLYLVIAWWRGISAYRFTRQITLTQKSAKAYNRVTCRRKDTPK
jgi:uncharacterized membrane protein HdeD (DUF308 family)